MAPISAAAVSEALERAYRAALPLTGSAELAEMAVLKGIACLELGDDVEKAVLANTVEFVIRRPHYEHRLGRALALPVQDELRRLVHLAPDSRDCFLLRVLFGIPSAICLSVLDLTVEEFETSLSEAFRRLSGRGDPFAWSNEKNTEHRNDDRT